MCDVEADRSAGLEDVPSLSAIEERSHASAVDATALSSGRGVGDELVSTQVKELKPASNPSRPIASDATRPLDDPFDSRSDEEGSSDHEEEVPQPDNDQEAREAQSKNKHVSTTSNPFRMPADTGQGRSPETSKPRPGPRPVSFAGKDARGRTSLDVDAFKRLLLTGSTNPTVAGMSSSAPKTTMPINVLGDAASITDASSISRHSIFESVPEGQADTPRTSHEISEDERRRWRDDVVHGTDHRRPPPPAPRHGKPLVKLQTADTPYVNIAQDDGSVDAPETRSNNRTPRPTTNLNKPLPSPPSASEKLDLAIDVPPALTSNEHIPSLPMSPSRRTPPKPPLSRQHSRAASHVSLSRAGSTDKTKKYEMGTPASSDLPHGLVEVPVPRRAPRPPTPRRSTLERASEEQARLQDSLVVLPASGEAITGLSLTREPSTSSAISRHASKGKVDGTPTRSSTMGPPPPPPPPRRRRGSSRSSVHSSTLSSLPSTEPVVGVGVPINTPRSVSEEMGSTALNRQRHSSPPPAENQKLLSSPNLNAALDDLTTLQREVDALRGKMERVGE